MGGKRPQASLPERSLVDVHILGWIGLAIVVIALITTDIVGHVRKPHAPSMKEATAWTLGYVALAAAFGVAI